jgi:hypothetical protein
LPLVVPELGAQVAQIATLWAKATQIFLAIRDDDCAAAVLKGSTPCAVLNQQFGLPQYVSGDAMIPEELKPADAESSAKNEETQPKDSPQEDPDTARGEAFKRMFPDVSKSSGRAKKPAE